MLGEIKGVHTQDTQVLAACQVDSPPLALRLQTIAILRKEWYPD